MINLLLPLLLENTMNEMARKVSNLLIHQHDVLTLKIWAHRLNRQLRLKNQCQLV